MVSSQVLRCIICGGRLTARFRSRLIINEAGGSRCRTYVFPRVCAESGAARHVSLFYYLRYYRIDGIYDMPLSIWLFRAFTVSSDALMPCRQLVAKHEPSGCRLLSHAISMPPHIDAAVEIGVANGKVYSRRHRRRDKPTRCSPG